MAELRYPSLLIISRRDVLADTDSTSVTIRSFLGNWPGSKITLICCEDFNAGESGRVSESCFRLTNSDVLLASHLFRNQRPSSTSVGQPVIITNKGLLYRVKATIKHFGYLFYTCLPYKRNRDLIQFLIERKPAIIYSNFTNLRMLRLVNTIAHEFGLSVVPHFFDDWPSVYKGSLGYFFLNKALVRLFSNSKVCLCISQKMCEEYMKRYHLNRALPLLNSVDPHYQDNSDIHSARQPFTFVFAGSLYLGRNESLSLFCEQLERISSKVSLRICAPESQWEQFKTPFEKYSFVEYSGFLKQEEMSYVFDTASCLLFVESFDESYLQYTRFSLSTRIPEYLSTGIPIMAIGNGEQGSIEYLEQNCAAYVADEIERIGSEIERCMGEKDRQTIISAAKRLFEKNHSREAQENKFYNVITTSL